MNIDRTTLKHIFGNIAVFFIFFSLYTLIALRSAASLLLTVPFFVLMFARYKVNNITAFSVIHACVLAIPAIIVHALTNTIDTSAPVAAFCLISVVYSFIARTNSEWLPRPGRAVVAMVLLNAAMLYLSTYFGDERSIYFTGSTLAILVCAIIYTHIDNLDARLKALQDQNPRYIGDILRGNNKDIAFFASAVAFIGFFVFFLPMDELGRLIIAFLRWIGSLIARFNQTLVPEAFLDPTAPPAFMYENGNGDIWYDAPEVVRSDLWQTLITFFTNIALILVVGGIVLALAYAFRQGFYSKHRRKAIATTELSTETDEVSNLSKPLLSDILSMIPRPKDFIKHPVRRAYAKKVNSHIKSGVSITHSDTPEVIAAKIRPTENIDDLTASYEKVRYGEN